MIWDQSGFWSLNPYYWLCFGIFYLCLLAMTLWKQTEWQLQHKKTLWWLMSIVLFLTLRFFVYGFITFHQTTIDDLSHTAAASRGYLAGLCVATAIFVGANVGLPLYFCCLPCVYAALFCTSPSLGSWYVVLYTIMSLPIILGMANDLLRQQRMTFVNEVWTASLLDRHTTTI